MTENRSEANTVRHWMTDKIFMGLTIGEYIKRNITPFNIVAALILAVGLPVTVIRFAKGLGAATNLSDTNPWGLWIGFDVLCGVALAAGGFTISSAVYLFGLKKYHPIVRPAILTGFLGYFLVVVGLLFDLGRPWRLPYPIFVSQGTTSVMFEVALCVALYLTVLFIEFSPAALEWLGLKRLRGWVVKMTIALTILGLILSTMHQSSLGALFLIAPGKLHPLWYSPFIPVFFFVSAIIAGLSMVIFESMLSHRAFSNQIEHHDNKNFDELIIGLGKAASIALLSYFGLKWLGVIDGNHWGLLNSRMGYWFLVEVFVFVLLPAFLYAWGVREQNANIIRFTAIFTVAGIILNRINVSIIAFNWNAEVRYFPRWMEFAVTITIITFGLLMFRWIANRMPILYEHADYKDAH